MRVVAARSSAVCVCWALAQHTRGCRVRGANPRPVPVCLLTHLLICSCSAGHSPSALAVGVCAVAWSPAQCARWVSERAPALPHTPR
ncbi:uncharacterized protein C8Q71DRAFT_778823 [Rhodofomes roseus]|uniref:Secreted protein n=1 Tax=Rhodofomes roseus TaxID=34475 RepID=A0ABQ8K0A2_9APHY|nr:uncharacterized protein C8Q71DRAFT_790462 [Rhodofomes roseus]XP_047773946.1 uncharacterized protein C8Q71DRAFT_785344 [Rhodofomes roseus]XP_047775006.1 uncharacterized protein C8Q71DRAFT_778823 [Rhodofomes roseus]KAH9829483.1 hypothetical protein C8Q71DRAFT_790462 [Rhodofomes roseus]KAH9830651.1 hypothetical protein C8Q71DRAFT_785344 [Rhodofomes roseus]KAH9831960.1 hypothetical protein C8Q71DRAFT_778823 [Rhodofomes roseus]